MTSPTLGFVGLGVMGEPMCRNLARKSGHSVIAWDARREPLERLLADGVAAARSLSDLADKADIVFLSLPGEPEIRAVAKGLQGNTVVDCSTAPVSGKSCRRSRRISSVESVVVWSSMSSVTVVPALRAAEQIVRALSRATLSPSSGSAWPTADSFTDTSAPAVSPAAASAPSTAT